MHQFLKFIFGIKLNMFRTVPLSIIRSFHCTHSNGICHTGLLIACEQDQDGTPSWSCSQAVSKPLWHIPLFWVQWKTPDDGHRNCLKYVEFYSKNKFEKIVHLVGFIIRIFCEYSYKKKYEWHPAVAKPIKTPIFSPRKPMSYPKGVHTAQTW